MKLLELYDCYKERLLQSAQVKEYFLTIVTASKKLLKPEMKQSLEDFELKVNLDENAMLELKQNNPRLNMKEELARLKQKNKSKGRAAAASTVANVEMEEIAVNNHTRVPDPNIPKRRTRADFD